MPKPYLAKIINSLVHHGLVLAKRGYRGGISLGGAPENISLLEVVEAVEGKNWLGPCLLGLDDCASRRVCPTQLRWKGVRQQIIAILDTTSVVSPKGLDITQSFVFCWRGLVEPGLIASSFVRARSSFLMMSSTLAVQTNGRGDSFHAAR